MQGRISRRGLQRCSTHSSFCRLKNFTWHSHANQRSEKNSGMSHSKRPSVPLLQGKSRKFGVWSLGSEFGVRRSPLAADSVTALTITLTPNRNSFRTLRSLRLCGESPFGVRGSRRRATYFMLVPELRTSNSELQTCSSLSCSWTPPSFFTTGKSQ